MGGVITGTAFTAQFPSIDTTSSNGNATLQGFTVAIYNIGCWLGALLTMFIGDRLGRKRTIMVGAAILAVGTVIQCSAYSLAQLLVSNKCLQSSVIFFLPQGVRLLIRICYEGWKDYHRHGKRDYHIVNSRMACGID
jgi:MFS family permease